MSLDSGRGQNHGGQRDRVRSKLVLRVRAGSVQSEGCGGVYVKVISGDYVHAVADVEAHDQYREEDLRDGKVERRVMRHHFLCALVSRNYQH